MIFHHEVGGIFIYVVVYGKKNEEHTCICTLYHSRFLSGCFA
jgi:hypothetical protein